MKAEKKKIDIVKEVSKRYPNKEEQSKNLYRNKDNIKKAAAEIAKKTPGEKYPMDLLAMEIGVSKSKLDKMLLSPDAKNYNKRTSDFDVLSNLEKLCNLEPGMLTYPRNLEEEAKRLTRIDGYKGEIKDIELSEDNLQIIDSYVKDFIEQFEKWELSTCYRCVCEANIFLHTPTAIYRKIKRYFSLETKYQKLVDSYLQIFKEDIVTSASQIMQEKKCYEMVIADLLEVLNEGNKKIDRDIKAWTSHIKMCDSDDQGYKYVLLLLYRSMIASMSERLFLFPLYAKIVEHKTKSPYLLILSYLAQEAFDGKDNILDTILMRGAKIE